MELTEAKELFADILIAYQRGEIDLADALVQIREMDTEEVPEYDDDDESEDEAVDESEETPAEEEPGEVSVDPELELVEAELDAALEVAAAAGL